VKRYLERKLKLRHLAVIDAIGSRRSLLKAGKTLGVTQPALTQSLREIEGLMGAPLFHRHPKGMTATALGERVIETARNILFELKRLEAELDQTVDQGAGTVVVGALPAAAIGLLPGVIARMRATHSQVRIRVLQGRTEEMLAALGIGEVDLVVGRLYEPESPDRFRRVTLYREPIVVVARADHPLLRHRRVTAAMLARFQLALPTATQRVYRDIEAFLAGFGLEPTDALRSSSLPLIREMLLSTDAVAIMPKLMMAGDLLRGAVREVPTTTQSATREGGLILHADRKLLPPAQAFVEVLRAYVGELDTGKSRRV
jgi:LysR family pca operon transcriptional activator